MKNKIKPEKPTRQALEQRIFALEAQLSSSYYFADQTIEKAGIKKMMGSSVIMTLTTLEGKNLILPVAIKDGLSKETIAAIKIDLKRSYDLAVMFSV